MTREMDLFLDRVAERVRAARKRAGLTIEQLALQAGILPGDLSKLERNRLPLRLHHLKRLADALGAAPATFLDATVDLPEFVQPALDPHYIVDPAERKLLAAYRELRGKEQRIVYLLASEMRKTRDRRYDPRARKRKVNWKRDRHAHLPGTAGLVAEPSAEPLPEGAQNVGTSG